MVLHWCVYLLLVLVISQSFTDATLSKNSPKKKAKVKQEILPATTNVRARGLVSEEVKFKDIVTEHHAYCEPLRQKKIFPSITLAYVTPWNNHGYDVAKIFGSKFTYVSPVWLQLKSQSSSMFSISGEHDIDQGWIKDVRRNGAKLVPRILFDGWSGKDYHALFSSEDVIEDCIQTITEFITDHDFDGIVVEVWSQLGGQRKSDLIHFLLHLGEALHEEEKAFILVLPPPSSGPSSVSIITQQDVEKLAPQVDAFSLMTYDYSNHMKPGPNSPLQWMSDCVTSLVPHKTSPIRRKILLGMNFYGNDYLPGGGGPIVGSQFIDILNKHKPKFRWDESYKEHVAIYKSGAVEHSVYFPSLMSVDVRIELAKTLGTGLSLWEVGQGLDYFYDLL